MEEHLQLVGIVGLVACVVLGIVVIALCIVLCCQRCRHRDAANRPILDSEARGDMMDEPPDYAWCAENAGYNPDQMPESESTSQGSGNDEIPPTYDSIVQTGRYCIILDPNQLPQQHIYSNKGLSPIHTASPS